MASTAGGARHLVTKGHLDRLLVSAGGGGGSDAGAPDPLLGASALRTLAKVLAKAEGVGLDVSVLVVANPFKNACTRNILSGEALFAE